MSATCRLTPRAATRLLASALAAALVAATQAPLPAAAQALPSLGESDGFSVGDERRLGDAIARQLYRDPDYLDDPVLQEYVQGIWQALMQAASQTGALGDALGEQFAWRVLLGKDKSVNAFALPGGYFGLHLGLINVVDSRDELASVMAHELSHVSQRHISRMAAQNARQTPLLIASMILGALAASKSPDAAQAVIAGGQALAVQNSLNFTRAMEQEADRIGLDLMKRAGFDPTGFIGMFEKLHQANRLNDSGAYPYLRTHPLTSQRLSDMQGRLPQGPRYRRPQPTLEHALIVARSRVLSLGQADFLRATVQAAHQPVQATAAQANTTENRQTPSAQHQQAARLYAGALAAAQLRDFAHARQWAAQLTEALQNDADALRQARLLDLELALAARDTHWAHTAAQRLRPLPSDTPARRPELFLRTAYVVDAQGQDATLAEQWQSWLGEHPDDAGGWQQLARLWTAQGLPLRAIRAQAEAQAARLDYAAAIDRLKAGQQLLRELGPKADHVDASILQSRLSLMQRLHREQEQAQKSLQ